MKKHSFSQQSKPSLAFLVYFICSPFDTGTTQIMLQVNDGSYQAGIMVNLIPSTEEKKMNKSIFLSRVYSFVWHIVYSQSPRSCHIRQFLKGKTLCSHSFLCVCGLESICMFAKSFFFLTSTLSFTNLLLCKPKYTSVY